MSGRAKEILNEYYDGWLKSDRHKARALIHDDLIFRSPNDNFDGAEAFFEVCWPVADQFNEMNIIQEVYTDDAAYIAYKFSDICCGEFHKIRDGKIAEVYVTFNPTI